MARFLREQHSPKFLFGDVSDLGARAGIDLISGNKVFIPEVNMFSAGFSCKSRTPCSSKSRTNRDCIQKGDMTAETSYTFHHMFEFVKRKRPQFLLLENVKQLAQQTTPEATSDADYIRKELIDIHYLPMVFIFDSHDFGSIGRRVRLYCIAINLDQSQKLNPQAIKLDWWLNFYNLFTIPPAPIGDIIIYDIAKLQDLMDGFGQAKELAEEKQRGQRAECEGA